MILEASRSVLERAKEWVRQDPNPLTCRYVQSLLLDEHQGNEKEKEEKQQLLLSLFPSDGNRRISFGTAGLRSNMKPGPLGMNDLTVIQTAQGLARYCQEQKQKQHATTKTKIAAVVGYDHRANPTFNLSSLQFALYTILVFQEVGCFDTCWLLDGYVATPLVPFAMRQIQLEHQQEQSSSSSFHSIVLGIMITASHNPKQDAGYKVYWGETRREASAGTDVDDTTTHNNNVEHDGYCCQITSPRDSHIAQCILQNLEPWIDYGARLQQLAQKQQHEEENQHHDPCLGLSQPTKRTKGLVERYFQTIATCGILTGRKHGDAATMTTSKPPNFCYTALHGVGYPFAKHMLENVMGILPAAIVVADVVNDKHNQNQAIHVSRCYYVSVPQQQEPDYNFSTVSFPNPEEKGALSLAQEYALQHGCNIILAHDPDADRLAVAEYNGSAAKGRQWTVFTGDQIGTMLGHWLWQQVGSKLQNNKNGGDGSGSSQPVAMLASTVSSKMLAEIARVEGFRFEDTLTGFKWIGSRAAELEQNEGYRSLFCYEEAIGFCCGTGAIFDKDGISAMGVFAELALSVYCDHGLTLQQHLQSLYDKYGEFVSNNGYFFLPDVSLVPKLMNEISNHGRFDTLVSVGPYKVSSIRYLGEPGYDSTQPDRKPTLPTSATSPMLSLWLEDDEDNNNDNKKNGSSSCCVAQFRASGTEPKFKYYIELKGKPGVARAIVQQELEKMSRVILQELLHPEQNGLVRPSKI